ncbi:hypothetical protein DUGA2_44020 [Duganella sp. HH101]|nr:hypothetical protein DUGA2_44020 [Duganella sp. HH101]
MRNFITRFRLLSYVLSAWEYARIVTWARLNLPFALPVVAWDDKISPLVEPFSSGKVLTG